MHEDFHQAVSDSGILEKAEQTMEQRIRREPRNVNLLSNLGRIYRKCGHLDRAEAVYGRLTKIASDDDSAAYAYALLSGTALPPWPNQHVCSPSPFALIRGFLPREFNQELVRHVISMEGKFVSSLIRYGDYDPDTRSSLTLHGAKEIRQRFRKHVEAEVGEVFSRLGMARFKIDHMQICITAYRHGHFFKAHQDHNCDNRQINFVYFFHREPRSYTGGDLLLFDTDTATDEFTPGSFTRIVPVNNSIVFFPSRSYHQVATVNSPSRKFVDSRFVINGHISS